MFRSTRTYLVREILVPALIFALAGAVCGTIGGLTKSSLLDTNPTPDIVE